MELKIRDTTITIVCQEFVLFIVYSIFANHIFCLAPIHYFVLKLITYCKLQLPNCELLNVNASCNLVSHWKSYVLLLVVFVNTVGRSKGVQGHRNSCYLDAVLFSMFSFSSAFDSILIEPIKMKGESTSEDVSTAIEVQRILRDDIVNPLRKELMTPATNVMALRETMLHLDHKLTTEEMGKFIVIFNLLK